ncbi:phenylacetaldehyde reductase [Nicotiana tabacum]|uniref:Dihydroflavonol 4-reductase n=1 Tax=Nicotiana tabacum TaxID=4097 RepID=A0A1S3X594_TOBAC|nr:PREDICTED: cinnamoyl-CoA reductase 1-like [Nicotiana tabacum]XP_033514239.1 cinnamoyl-CoA reductase 1-like [Nicotiana tomentosiformis]
MESKSSGGGEGKVVCVTGASGFIASWLVKMLLQRGYTVNATVRNLKDASKVDHLLGLDGAKERLHLFKAELLGEHSFDPAVDGCEGVFHTASPVSLTAKSKEELVDPAVSGTLNVLRSCTKSTSVRRVVITSSTASVICNKNMSTPGAVADETWYSDAELCEERKEWYQLSKTLAEEAAWKFAKENGLDLVTLHPGLVIGPLLQPTLNFSCEAIVNFIKEGKEAWSGGIYRFVDVRDVANAHILAFEVPSANGRYCLVGVNGYSSLVLKIVQKLYPSITLPENFEDGLPLIPTFQVSSERAKSLGVNFTSLELSVKDTVESLIEKNFLKI